jgi:hypothetical protein
MVKTPLLRHAQEKIMAKRREKADVSDFGERLNGELFQLELKECLPRMSPDDIEGLLKMMEEVGLQNRGSGPQMAIMRELVAELRSKNLSCALEGIAKGY